ncbi:gastric inhibitory polypeptide [Rhinatrema bivittatum]|uniref:gastric inhibitory polypeptide n=1 Tax=Rhinatrema bivittatum TaxID=194408 RepID=UPI001127ED64|nr:gastric inhibitory polypeptide [Rhinatrema bivittatum]
MMSFKVLSLFMVSLTLIFAEMEPNGLRATVSSQSSRPLQRRYSEAILASDYSRTVDNLLKKDFVNWLLSRREKKSDTMTDPAKRNTDTQITSPRSHEKAVYEENILGAKNLFAWLLKNRRKESSPDMMKGTLDQELLDLLISSDL